MSNENLVGKTLANRYEILELIGSGGMATVYKAHCNLLNRNVAIKVLRNSLGGEESVVKNFKKESQAAASISHTNIVSVYDVGEENGILYMVMEYVDGITLKEYIKQNGALDWHEACGFAIQICQGLSEAHKNNIVHRDIKPQNILMTQDKTLKVTDFGIARASASETAVIGGGNAVGSVHYISPEQARGGYTDAKSDIYSLGVVLYEMLTGNVPFDGDNAVAVALKHIEKEPVPVKCDHPDIPDDLSYVTSKAMSKETVNRYGTVDDMMMDLRAVLAEETLPSVEMGTMLNVDDNFGETKRIPVDEVKDGITPTTTQERVVSVPAMRRRQTVSEDEIPAEEDEYGEDEYDDDFDYDEEDEYDDDEDIKKKKKTKKRRKKKKEKTQQQKKEDKLASILAIATVLVIAIVAGVVYLYLNSSSELTVPDFSNMTIEEAEAKALDEGFTIADEIEYSISDDVEEGLVLSQTPEANKKVKSNNEVKLVISLGSTGGTIEVPDVRGLDEDTAITQILEKNLSYNIVMESSDSVDVGKVIRQLPTALTRVNEGEKITVYISTGPEEKTDETEEKETVTVPSVEGMTYRQAEQAIIDAGLQVGNVSRKNSNKDENTVLSQSPASGKTAEANSYVSIVISNGISESTTPAPTAAQKSESKATEKPSATEAPDPTKVPVASSEDSKESAVSTKSYTVRIPSDSSDSVEVKINVDGTEYYSGKHNKSEGSVTVKITGSGTSKITAYIDGDIVDSSTIDFGE